MRTVSEWSEGATEVPQATQTQREPQGTRQLANEKYTQVEYLNYRASQEVGIKYSTQRRPKAGTWAGTTMGTTHPSQLAESAASDARFRILWSSLLLVPPPASPPAVPAHLILAVLEARPLDPAQVTDQDEHLGAECTCNARA